MIEHGWRRYFEINVSCGENLVYKPAGSTCCVQHTVRVDIGRFKPSKQHRQALNRMLRTVSLANSQTDMRSVLRKLWNCGRLRTVLGAADFSEKKFELFEKYEAVVHGKTSVSRKSFCDFLVATSLQTKELKDPIELPAELSGLGGTYHVEYFLDSALIAVSVIDILPKSLSAVYAFYEPELRNLCLGKITALTEIQMAKDIFGPRGCYHLGYYIHTCPKMRYKVEFKPCELLDLADFSWVSSEIALPKLEINPKARTFFSNPAEFTGHQAKREFSQIFDAYNAASP